MMENMLTGRLYLSSELSGGVFDEASRALDEEQVQILGSTRGLLSMVCAWDNNKVFLALCRSRTRRVSVGRVGHRVWHCTGRRAFAFHSYRLTFNMDSDEEMQQFDSEPPPFPSAAKGKGKAVLGDEPEEPPSGRDDTLPWYVKFLSRSK